MVIVLWLIMALVLYLSGYSVMRCLYGNGLNDQCGPGEILPAGFCVLIGCAQVCHLSSVFLNWSVSRIAFLLLAVLSVLTVAGAVILATSRSRQPFAKGSRSVGPWKMSQQLLAGAFALSVVFQVIMIMTGDKSCNTGDMTLEMVRTNLAQDQVYSINPLTGQPYTAGVPIRLKILCLPSLYTFICRLTGLDAELVVCRLMPVVVLVISYFAYSVPGKILFGSDRTGRLLMLLVISVLFWCGDYMDVMDGFLLLHGGYRGVAVRNGILFPFTLGMCMQKKWKLAALSILAETCIVWTLYGLGACLLVVVVMLLINLWIRVREGRGGETCRNS